MRHSTLSGRPTDLAQSIPSFVRFCRDYSIADLFFVIFAAISGAYVISTNSSIRTGLCEDVSSQPDFIRDLVDMGFNLENCEVWFERAVIGLMTVSAVVIIVRVSRTIWSVRIPTVLSAVGCRCFVL